MDLIPNSTIQAMLVERVEHRKSELINLIIEFLAHLLYGKRLSNDNFSKTFCNTSLSPYVSERTKRRQLARRVEEIMNQLKIDAYVNVEHIPSYSNTDVNDVSRFRNSTDSVSQSIRVSRRWITSTIWWGYVVHSFPKFRRNGFGRSKSWDWWV